jgi:hypothetical protein
MGRKARHCLQDQKTQPKGAMMTHQELVDMIEGKVQELLEMAGSIKDNNPQGMNFPIGDCFFSRDLYSTRFVESCERGDVNALILFRLLWIDIAQLQLVLEMMKNKDRLEAEAWTEEQLDAIFEGTNPAVWTLIMEEVMKTEVGQEEGK